MKNQISMYDLHKRFQEKLNQNEIVLDVRGQDEYAEGHVPGSLNVPYDEVSRVAESLKKYSAVYIHCRSGKRAQVAYGVLERLGLKNLVCIADGGMVDWLGAGYEVTKGK